MTTQKSPSGGRGRKTFTLTFIQRTVAANLTDYWHLTGLDQQWFRPGNTVLVQGLPGEAPTTPSGLILGQTVISAIGTLDQYIGNVTAGPLDWPQSDLQVTVFYERDDSSSANVP